LNAIAFLDCARNYANQPTEADWRSAISRAYYAVFHHFREWFASKGLKLGNAAQAHSNLHLGLLNCGIAGLQTIESQIDDLRQTRTFADYDLWKNILRSDARVAVDLADKILSTFLTVLQSAASQQTVGRVRQYLVSIGRITP